MRIFIYVKINNYFLLFFFYDGQIYGIDDDSVAGNASVFYKVAPAETITEK